MLADAQTAAGEDTAAIPDVGDAADSAPPIAAEQVDDAIAVSLRERLEAIERAEARIADGSYGHVGAQRRFHPGRAAWKPTRPPSSRSRRPRRPSRAPSPRSVDQWCSAPCR